MDPHPPITVVVARLDDLLALGVHALLSGDPNVSVLAADVAYERISVVVRAHRPRVLILDVARLTHLGQVRELAIEHPATRLVLLGERLSSVESAQLLAFGASAALAKDTQGRDLLNAIHLASRGMQLMPFGTHTASGAAAVRDSRLTPREGDVLGLLRDGQSNGQIALALSISVETVRSHARHIYRKLGVSSRRALLTLPPPSLRPPAGELGSARRRHPRAGTSARR